MNPERWRQIEQLYHSVLQREPEHRAAFLAAASGDDEELRREVEFLLAQSGSTGGLIDRPAWEAATDLADSIDTSTILAAGMRLGPYQILGPLGEGGMGTVYRGLDTRLNRAVAIKFSSEHFSRRFEREARIISALNHPHICTLYDVGAMPSGSSYMVTELVEGETLRDWIKRAPAVERSLEIARQVLEALHAAHRAGIIHRDLKPANIMVRFDGYVKVLDFGIAKRIALPTDCASATDLTLPGQIIGTIRYMSPEQIQGQEVDQRCDLFAFGIILYEMLTGEHPWPRKTTVDTLHAILHEPPSVESGWVSVVNKLLRKNRHERFPSAEAVLAALASPTPPQAPFPRSLTRLIVLPFRILRQHDASDFLSVSLPDAITSSLAAIDSLVVRSTLAASRLAASAELDIKTIAEQAQVDAILTGTILSDGEHLRVNTQLVEALSGTALWSNTAQVSLRDIFQLQDELVDRIVQSLTLPLTAQEHRALKHDVPASAISYELYLRANQLAHANYDLQKMVLARDLYLRSAEEDPKYAPTWAGLGRIYRMIGKYGAGDLTANLARAQEAFEKAFQLNPDLSLAHNYYTSLQNESGRSLESMVRMLKRAQTHCNDPILLTGLVHACRYCGLLEASVAAHDLARRLDPHVRTTVVYSQFFLGNFQKAFDNCGPGDEFVRAASLLALGREQEAIALCLEGEKAISSEHSEQVKLLVISERAFLEGDHEKSLEALDRALGLTGPMNSDPEGRFWIARNFGNLRETERALGFISKALDDGYRCHYALVHDPSLDCVRTHPRFTELANRAAALDLEARTLFLDNAGDQLLGVHVDRKLPGSDST